MPRGRIFSDEDRAKGMRKLLKNPKVNAGMKRGIQKWMRERGFSFDAPEPTMTQRRRLY